METYVLKKVLSDPPVPTLPICLPRDVSPRTACQVQLTIVGRVPDSVESPVPAEHVRSTDQRQTSPEGGAATNQVFNED